MPTIISQFSNDYEFLSNFYKCSIIWCNKVWPSAEHLYQTQKTLDRGEQELIRTVTTPGKAKRLGQTISLRHDWDEIKYDIMLKTIHMKFHQSLQLSQLLMLTNEAILIEGNNFHDNLWGNCRCTNCTRIIGKNWLGKILMTMRGELLLGYF